MHTPRRLLLVGLLAAPCLLDGGPAQGGPPADDGVPSGTVAFFSGGKCPAGWASADDLRGRLVVAVTDGTTAGVTVGVPLGDREDRSHAHTWEAMVSTQPKALAAADGSNDSGAAAQTYAVMGATDPGTTGLPFVQEQPCVKP
jgi:hypothetical protein